MASPAKPRESDFYRFQRIHGALLRVVIKQSRKIFNLECDAAGIITSGPGGRAFTEI